MHKLYFCGNVCVKIICINLCCIVQMINVVPLSLSHTAIVLLSSNKFYTITKNHCMKKVCLPWVHQMILEKQFERYQYTYQVVKFDGKQQCTQQEEHIEKLHNCNMFCKKKIICKDLCIIIFRFNFIC